jgi:hypothetical protein
MDPIAMFCAWFTLPGPAGLSTWTTPLTLYNTSLNSTFFTSAATPTWYVWQNQTLLSVWQTIMVMLATDSPNYFFRITPWSTVILQLTTVTQPNHIFVLPQHLSALSYTKDFTKLKNNILRVGSTPSITATALGGDVSTFGLRSDFASDVRLTTQAQAQVLANGTLAIEDRVQYRAQITVVDFRGDNNPSLGYDIENIAVGDSVQIVNLQYPPVVGGASVWDTAHWDQNIWDASNAGFSIQTQIVQVVGISYQYDYVVLELATHAPSVSRALSQLAQAVQDFTILPGV